MIRRKYRRIRNVILCLVLLFCISLLNFNNDKTEKGYCPSDTLFETVHIFNAIAEAKSEWKSVEYIVINVLDGSTFRSIFECCMFGKNKSNMHRSKASVEDSFKHRLMQPELAAKQFKCSIKTIKFKPVHIGLVENGNSCDPCITVTSLIYPLVMEHGADRGFESTNWNIEQSGHDEQVAVYTCQAYLQGYGLVAIIDFDEFIVQDKFISYKHMVKSELLPLYPQAAAFTFNVSFFITDWGVSGVQPLLTSQYIQRTNPRYERYKNMYIPKRTQNVNTHEVQPKAGYKRISLRSHNVVLHHYRTCPNDLKWKYCMHFTPIIDKKMLKLMPTLLRNVMSVKEQIGII
ncbi:uncharacterized protein LOC127727168 isoform X2 [Mytilus californianus]|uniref:uncharacterized protein LOC127727168 isoform X2 n=1 Tax=Mytilus californianus TaxID=6549 RepID=UPI0022471785|nr:uncharacterized protein LOC127727168 isoform X2 [Mytilus californianus]